MDRTDHNALLAAVLEDPDDDTPRLIMADWYEENGNPDRAEYVRTMIEWYHLTPCRHGWDLLDRVPDCRYCELTTLEEWFTHNPVEGRPPKAWRPDSFLGTPGHDYMNVLAYWNRGFVWHVGMPCDVLLGGPCQNCRGAGEFTDVRRVGPNYGKQIPCDLCSGHGNTPPAAPYLFERHPIVAVTLDKHPLHVSPGPRYMWGVGSSGEPNQPHQLPPELTFSSAFEDMPAAGTSAVEMRKELSSRLVDYGRALVDLSPLTRKDRWPSQFRAGPQ